MPFLQNDLDDTLIIRSIRKDIPAGKGVTIREDQTDNADVQEAIERGLASLHKSAKANSADAKDATQEADTGPKNEDSEEKDPESTSATKTGTKSTTSRTKSKSSSSASTDSDSSAS